MGLTPSQIRTFLTLAVVSSAKSASHPVWMVLVQSLDEQIPVSDGLELSIFVVLGVLVL